LVRKISTDTRDSCGQSDQLNNGIVDANSRMQTTAGDLTQVISLSRHLDADREANALDSFLGVTRFDHVAFKLRIYRGLLGLEQIDPDTLPVSTACRLGKWCSEGEGKRRFGHLGAFRRLDAPHGIFHEAGKAAMRAATLAEATPHVMRMEKASIEVLSALDALAVEIRAETTQR